MCVPRSGPVSRGLLRSYRLVTRGLFPPPPPGRSRAIPVGSASGTCGLEGASLAPRGLLCPWADLAPQMLRFRAWRGATWALELHSQVTQGSLADQDGDGGIKMRASHFHRWLIPKGLVATYATKALLLRR